MLTNVDPQAHSRPIELSKKSSKPGLPDRQYDASHEYTPIRRPGHEELGDRAPVYVAEKLRPGSGVVNARKDGSADG